ncbi:MAG: hypothetical protein QOJ99_504 [Bryobacterales bacterium]|nr:hypothetical protein [Bryobacterales bacterium]
MILNARPCSRARGCRATLSHACYRAILDQDAVDRGRVRVGVEHTPGRVPQSSRRVFEASPWTVRTSPHFSASRSTIKVPGVVLDDDRPLITMIRDHLHARRGTRLSRKGNQLNGDISGKTLFLCGAAIRSSPLRHPVASPFFRRPSGNRRVNRSSAPHGGTE